MIRSFFLQTTALAALTVTSSGASVFAYNSSLSAVSRVDGPYVVGNVFRVNQAGGVTVTHLGIQDVDAASDAQDPDGADGMTSFADDDGFYRDTFGGGAPLQVGLWTADGATLLASATVGSLNPVTGSYRYAVLNTPVSLTQGTTYLIGATVGGGIEWFLDGEPATLPYAAGGGITLLENRYAISGALVAPVTNGAGTSGRWAPANAMFTAVPEPSTMVLGIAGALGMTLRRRRR